MTKTQTTYWRPLDHSGISATAQCTVHHVLHITLIHFIHLHSYHFIDKLYQIFMYFFIFIDL